MTDLDAAANRRLPRPLRAIQQIQIGRVCSAESQARAVLNRLAEVGFEAIELNGFMTRPTPLLVRALTKMAGMPVGRGGRLDWQRLVADSGLAVIALHEDLGTIEREPAAVVERARGFGCGFVVITGMYRFDYTNHAALDALARRLDAAGRRLRADGVQLLYHNHSVEFRRLAPGRTAFAALVEQTDPSFVGFELDCYWVAAAGGDPVALLESLGERVQLVHVTDRGSRSTGSALTPIDKADSVELGLGNMDIPAIIETAARLGVAAVILETHKNWIDDSPLRSAEISAEALTRLLP